MQHCGPHPVIFSWLYNNVGNKVSIRASHYIICMMKSYMMLMSWAMLSEVLLFHFLVTTHLFAVASFIDKQQKPSSFFPAFLGGVFLP